VTGGAVGPKVVGRGEGESACGRKARSRVSRVESMTNVGSATRGQEGDG
jgi:hypothetical protein